MRVPSSSIRLVSDRLCWGGFLIGALAAANSRSRSIKSRGRATGSSHRLVALHQVPERLNPLLARQL